MGDSHPGWWGQDKAVDEKCLIGSSRLQTALPPSENNEQFMPPCPHHRLAGRQLSCESWFILPFWVCLLADNRGITDIIPLFFLLDFFGTQPPPLPACLRVGLEAEGSIAPWSRDLDPGLRVQVLPRPSLPVCPWPAVFLWAFSSGLGGKCHSSLSRWVGIKWLTV